MTRQLCRKAAVGMTFFCFVWMVGCDIRSHSDEAPAPAIVDNTEFSNQLLEIAKSYETYEPFYPDTLHKLQVAPTPCRPLFHDYLTLVWR
jgi:hypothetical protein